MLAWGKLVAFIWMLFSALQYLAIGQHLSAPMSEPLIFPGGTYRASSTANFPESHSISGSLVNLTAGGMREPHWHDPAEWAFVLSGTCRVTYVDINEFHPAESWDFVVGDIWAFPSNRGHAILGLEDGCSYIAAYDNGDFDDLRDSKGLSAWLSSAPPKIVAQALGTSAQALDIKPDQNNFMPLGSLDKLTAGQSDPPLLALRASPYGIAGSLQATTQSHRFPLASAMHDLADVPGAGFIRKEDRASFPETQDFSGALVLQEPYSLRQLHWHPEADEWQFLINGTLEVQAFNGSGLVYNGTLKEQQIGFIPRSMGHYLKNNTPDPAYYILVFSNGRFTDADLHNFIGNLPVEYLALALGSPASAVSSWSIASATSILQGSALKQAKLQPAS